MAHARDRSLAVGYVADGGQVAYYAAPRSSVTWPHQVGVLPRRADCFQDRAAAEQLQQAVADGSAAARCQVLVGMGGVGKTQLAVHHARALWQAGGAELLVWVSAGTRTAIVSAYAQAAAEVLGTDHSGTEKAARAFLAWLEPRHGASQRSWLIVLDDLTDPADLRGLWPPASPHGRTLITTRRRDAAMGGSGRRLVPVGLFTSDEATAYLTAGLAAHGRTEPAGQLAALAADLGYLPLALSQAVAYLIDADLDCVAYRTRLADRAHTLVDLLPDASGLPDNQSVSVAAAWSLSLDHADQLPPVGLARPMLQLIAVLDPNGIPSPVLTNISVLAHLTQHRAGTAGQSHLEAATAQDAERALRALHRLSLVDHTPRNVHQAVRVHQLVQRATRDTLTRTTRDHLVRTAANALFLVWPDIERDTALGQAMRANTTALTRYAEEALYQSDRVHPVLHRAGHSLGKSGQVTAAIDHFQQLGSAAHRHLGPDHPDTLDVRASIAHWQGKAGDAAGAASAYEQLLTDYLRVSGPDHLDTLNVRGAIADWRGKAGDAAGAARAYTHLLADSLRVLGPDHLRTLVSRASIADWQARAGNAADAARAYKEVLADYLRVLGPDDPFALWSRVRMAHRRGEAGDAVGAVSDLEQLSADYLRVLGPDHPDTLNARARIAHWRGEAGDPAGAANAFEQLLTDYLRVLGPDHPDTLEVRYDQIFWRGEAGDPAGAASAYEQLLTDYLRVLGPDHPDTLDTRAGIADWRGEAGDPAGAVGALEQLSADYLRVLGPDHPDTLDVRASITRWRKRVEDIGIHRSTDH
ncbi:tetratricopeptide repeat protein [Streptomyces antimycoticus]|uniref:tetratricopeptide repeat protein n=1 Tax=Streptomyces antimycoticus TaxID=68175 RepID=UPI001F424383|nr:tetratricopeptide repeat protein [Streptomyces antimycoticus]